MQTEKEKEPLDPAFIIADLEDSTAPSDDLARWRQKHGGAAGTPAFHQAAELDKAHRSNVDDLGAAITDFCEGDTRAIDRVLSINSPRRERPVDQRKTRVADELAKASASRLAGLRDYVRRMLQEGETIETLARSAEATDPETAEEFRQIGRELAADDGIRTVYA